MKKKSNNGFWGVLIIILAAVAIAGFFILSQMKDKEKTITSNVSDVGSSSSLSPEVSQSSSEATSSSSQESNSSSSNITSQSSSKTASGTDAIKARIAEIDEELNSDYLRLVSVTNPLDKSFAPTLATVAGTNKLIDKRVKPYLDSFLLDASNQGYKKPTTLSCYRDYAKQTNLYNNKIAQLENQGMSKEEATKEAGTIVAIPGTSEHQYGMSADISSSGSPLEPEKIEKMADNIWHRAHAAEYGFILRFPKGKEDITGIMYEPWHFRYVGKEHAKIITEKGLCLEEYLNMLKKEKSELQKKLK